MKEGAGFWARLSETIHRNDSLLCVGLDPPIEGLPDSEVLAFSRRIIEATVDTACCYKPNIAFYEARGIPGLTALAEAISFASSRGFPVILDAKRGDISSTASAYAKAAFEHLKAGALTINPLLGRDSVEPFTAYSDRGVFLLCHTSNPGARDLQELEVDGTPLYERIAALALSWNAKGNVGLVVGATYPEQIARVRSLAPDLWLLLPGAGAQGGELEESVEAGLWPDGSGLIVNVSRAIASAADPGEAARAFRDRINAVRKKRRERARERPVEGDMRGVADLDTIALGLHSIGAVRFGEFTLKSGQKSPLYIDLRLLVSDPKLMRAVARALAASLSKLSYDRIAAIPYGGLPIGEAVSLETGKPLIYPRREVKDHGTKKAIEGTYNSGETVVVLDDLVTTGASKLEAIEPLLAAGLLVRDIAVLVDREQGGAAELAQRGYRLHAVLGLSQLLEALVRRGRISPAAASEVRKALAIQ